MQIPREDIDIATETVNPPFRIRDLYQKHNQNTETPSQHPFTSPGSSRRRWCGGEAWKNKKLGWWDFKQPQNLHIFLGGEFLGEFL